MSATKPSIPARRFSRFERIKVEPPRFLGCARIRNETRVIPFSFHSTYILDSLPYGHSAFRKGFPVKFIQAEIYGILGNCASALSKHSAILRFFITYLNAHIRDEHSD
ncbi:hypothetical protein TWF569_002614 [Orbilia oligospora]|nr:hypothetical protein TWF569_002614 [Orbilia oligospora]